MDPTSTASAAARANGGIAVLIAVPVLTAACAVAIAIHRAAAGGDFASVAFVAVSYGALLLLRSLPAYETAVEAPPQDAFRASIQLSGGLTILGFGVLAFNSWLAIYTSWGDAASVALVLLADAALVLLFLCLRDFEQGGRGRHARSSKAALWAALTTLITAMFSGYASKVAPLVVVGALVFLGHGEFERAPIGLGGQYAELLKMGFSVVACDSALACHHARGDAGSLAFVFLAYASFVTFTWHFLRRFDGRALVAEQ